MADLQYKKIALEEDITVNTEDASSQSGIDIRDEFGNEVVNITDGNIKTHNFDSSELGSLSKKSNISDSDITGTISDSHIASATTWSAKQDALTAQTAYTEKGSSTKVPKITTNTLGQVTSIEEVNIDIPESGVLSFGGQSGNITINSSHLSMSDKELNVTNVAIEPSSNTISNAIEFADDNGNVVLQVDSSGNIQSKNFDSSDVASKVDKVSTTNKVYGTDSSGNQTTYDKDSFGQVDDVTVDGTSIVTNKVAEIETTTASTVATTGSYNDLSNKPITSTTTSSNALEISDASNNVVFAVDSNGNIKSKNFNSSNTLTTSDVVDSLYSTSTSLPLSANQGKALKTLIDNLPSPMVFKGTLGTSGTITDLPTATTSTVGHTYKVITDGTYASQTAKVGDLFICNDTPAWVLVPSGDEPSGTVTNIATGTGLTGGPITTSGTISLDASGVTAGTYQGITVDTYGRVTSASNMGYTTNTGTVTQVTAGTGLTGGSITTSGTLAVDTSVIQSKLTQGENITITDNTISATDTTYENKTAVSGGTDVSLVTTGEKYTWNNKQDALPTTSTSGKMLTSTSTAGTVEWTDVPSTGVTSVIAGTGLTGGTITSTGTIAVDTTVIAQQSDLTSKVDKVSTTNKVYGTDSSGNQTTYDKDSFGQVDDVTVDGTSVVSSKVATLTTTSASTVATTGSYNDLSNKPITSSTTSDSALEFSDTDNNIVMKVDGSGNLITKNFNSSDVETEISSKQSTLTTNSYVSVSGSSITNLAVDYKNVSAVSQGALKFVKCTQAEYSAISSPDASTLYIIVG